MNTQYTHLISVIVPVYNREKTLDVCIKGILHSEYKNIELILVDDGSTDNSLKICQKYVEEDTRVIVVSQKNQGVSAARNTGIRKAKGEWVSFIDSDDTILPNYFSLQINAGIEHCDLTMVGRGPAFIDDGQVKALIVEKSPIMKMLEGNENVVRFIFGEYNPYINDFYHSINKLFRRRVLIEHDLFFREDITLAEDQIFVLDYLRFVKTFYYNSSRLYMHFDWTENEKTYGLGRALRKPEYFLMIHKENYAAFERLYELSNDQGLKKYEVNYVLDRPISKILFQYTLFRNLKLYGYSRLKEFTKSEILPFLDKESANIDMLVDNHIAYYVKALFRQPFALVFVQLLFSSNMLYYKKKTKLGIKSIIKRMLGR